MERGMMLLFFSWNSWLDFRRREISLVSVGIFGALRVGLLVWQQEGWSEALSGAGVGLMVVMTAFFTKEAIGLGDGLFLVVTGLWLGFWETFQILLGGLLLSMVPVCGCLWTERRKMRRNVEKKVREWRLPLVPFLFLAYLGGRVFG